jgi:hypothetical protein
MTYTVALLPISQAAYDEIKARIEKINAEVGGNQYANMFMDDGGIDLTGVAVVPEREEERSWFPYDPGEDQAVTTSEEILHKLEWTTVKVHREDLPRLDAMVTLFDALAGSGVDDMYDDAWNLRNQMVPYVEGDEHFSGEEDGVTPSGYVDRECGECDGTGVAEKIEHMSRPCDACGGEGVIRVTETENALMDQIEQMQAERAGNK